MTFASARLDYGGDYNPEQWPPHYWEEDCRLMREAGVTMVSVGIFAWASLEPEPGEYTFEWLDEVLDRLHSYGIAACLATATASPPAWLARLHPETLPQTREGTRLWPGARQHYCPSSPVYRMYARRLVERIAGRYAEHPGLRLWHVGNEYGCHVPACWCDVSAADFRRWLQERHGTLEALNAAWSTRFWSQRYADWEEILPPRAMPTLGNPAQELDFRRFSSDALLACFQTERDVLRAVTPEVPLTTNFVHMWQQIDWHRWTPEVDVVAYDSYPDPLDPGAPVAAALRYDTMRGAKGGRPWLLLEQAPSAVNWRPVNGPKPPGRMRSDSLQAVARGADAVMFFQWRASLGGAEQFHSAMLPHGGTETRTWREVCSLGDELRGLADVAGSTLRARTALVMDWDSGWALDLVASPSERLRLDDQLLRHYRPLWHANIPVDVVPVTADLSAYDLIVVPNLFLVAAGTASTLAHAVRHGATLVVSCFSDTVDEHVRVRPGGAPGTLRDVLGIAIEESWPLGDADACTGRFVDGRGSFDVSMWTEVVRPLAAETIAEFRDGPLTGRPAITHNRFGHGSAWYCATVPEPEAMRRLLHQAAASAGVLDSSPGATDDEDRLEVVERSTQRTRFRFLLNHGDLPATHMIDAPATDASTGEAVEGPVTVAAGGAMVLRLGPPEAQ